MAKIPCRQEKEWQVGRVDPGHEGSASPCRVWALLQIQWQMH